MESSNLVRQKNCLVMAAASAVQAAREQDKNSQEEKVCVIAFYKIFCVTNSLSGIVT